MKKQLKIFGLIFLLIIVGLSGCFESQTPNLPNGNDLYSSEINIDGNITDWQYVPVSINDVEGDVRTEFNNGEKVYNFDVLNITLAIGSNNLFILFEFVKNIEDILNQYKNKGNIIGTISFDIDNDSVFESAVDIWTGVKDIETGLSSAGNGFLNGYTDDTIVDYFICYYILKYDSTENDLVKDWDEIRSDKKPEFIAYNQNFLELKIPRESIALQYNNDNYIRVVFDEFIWDSSESFIKIFTLI